MKHSKCKSSMEAHIEHCIASSFSSVPKAYSKKNIENYLKLHEMFLNGINILDYYLNTYNSNDSYIYNNEKEVDFYFALKNSTSYISNLLSSNDIYYTIHGFAYHDF